MRSKVVLVFLFLQVSCQVSENKNKYEVVVYGGTAGGVTAAIQASRLGNRVVLIEPGSRLGGMTTGGLGQTDIGNKRVIGGIAREFYGRIRDYYDQPLNWKWQKQEEYRDGGQTRTSPGETAMWTFEPSAALAVLEAMVEEAGIEVLYGERLNRSTGVMTEGTRIVSIALESGRDIEGKVFVDSTYEGDLMAAAGVSYSVGRESAELYGESLNGVQTSQALYHNFAPEVDPYVMPGDKESGLLPFIDPTGPGREGSGDRRIQAYCFRMCLTDHPENRIPFEKPEGYLEDWYELLLRNFEAGEQGMPWINSTMPNRKTDTNNRTGYSTDFIGQNYDYPEASYDERQEIYERHLLYQQGLMWTLATHPRVPQHIREEVARWGTSRDEFLRDDGWPGQLYIRESRRMLGSYLMTQHNCEGTVVADDPIGMAAYNMDSHNVQRYLDEAGFVRNEGDVQVRVEPYPISYRAIVPQRNECTNLLVPVALSATHIAFGSIRMEPVFMVLGQSAATAANLAVTNGADVQDVNYTELRELLLKDGQILHWQRSSAEEADEN